MNKKLIVYFSATGTTKSLALKLNNVLNGDLFEIKPKVVYSDDDLNWMDKNSRSSIEMNDKNSRPEIENRVNNIEEYDTLFILYPVWWYTYPTIINTFIESYDLKNKNIILVCTSGSSDIGDAVEKMQEELKDAHIIAGKRFSVNVGEEEIKNWIDSLNI